MPGKKRRLIRPVLLDRKLDWDHSVKPLRGKGWPLFSLHPSGLRLGLQPPDEESHAREETKTH